MDSIMMAWVETQARFISWQIDPQKNKKEANLNASGASASYPESFVQYVMKGNHLHSFHFE